MDRIEVYRGRGIRKKNRGWRWRYVASGNNARLATAHESYNSQDDALRGMRRVCGLPDPIPGQDGWRSLPAEGEELWIVTRHEDDSILVTIEQ